MSFSNRLYDVALRGCLTLAVCAALSGHSSAQDNDARPSEQTQQHEPNAQQPLPTAANQVQPKPDSDYYKDSCDRPKSREDDDLCQQRRMAKAAEDAVGWAAFQTKLGIAGFVAVVLSLVFTGWAAIAAGRAAKAAQQSADVSKEAFRRLERPYLFVKFDNMSTHYLRVQFVPHGIPFLQFKLVNYGKMPAVLRSIAFDLEPNPDLPLRIPMHANKDLYQVLEQGKESSLFDRVNVKGGEVGKPCLGDELTKLIFHGSYSYEDPTGALHIDRFCMRGTKDGKFVIEGGSEYNWRKTEYPQKPA